MVTWKFVIQIIKLKVLIKIKNLVLMSAIKEA